MPHEDQFNYNMGCIWMRERRMYLFAWMGLTITWDVFELAIQAAYPNYRPFNYNMGCIWMTLVFAQDVEKEV